MAQVALTGGVSEVVLAQGRGQAVWFQNFAAAKVWVKPAGAVDGHPAWVAVCVSSGHRRGRDRPVSARRERLPGLVGL